MISFSQHISTKEQYYITYADLKGQLMAIHIKTLKTLKSLTGFVVCSPIALKSRSTTHRDRQHRVQDMMEAIHT